MSSVPSQQRDVKTTTDSNVARLFDNTRKRLVETGTRNRLVHVNRANTRGNVLNIADRDAGDLYQLLKDGKTLRFHAAGRDRHEEPDEIEFSGVSAGADGAAGPDDQSKDLRLVSTLGPESLQKKLLKIAGEARTAEEESGVNILYLALGFLTWFEDKSSKVARHAPLVLLPVELVRNARTSTYDLRLREEDILTNLPLQQRLKEDFGIDLPELEVDDDWTPGRYFDEVEAAISRRENWKVGSEAIQLGFFSFSKLLMYRDLDPEAWPDGALAQHELTRGLLYEGFETEQPLFGPSDRLDEVLPPERLFHVVDADASQAKVIEEVRSGRNLVVQGPPGTGKSQTITNIVAAAARDGKRVLFVAEKMAALSVVHDRLVKVGLGDICLELHSRTAHKKTVLGEIARTLGKGSAVPLAPDAPNKLSAARDRLNALSEALHRPIGASGETAYGVLGRQSRFMGQGHRPPSVKAARLDGMTRQDEDRLVEVAQRYGQKIAADQDAQDHPFTGTRNLSLQPVDLDRVKDVLDRAAAGSHAFASALGRALGALGLGLAQNLGAAPALGDLLDRLDDFDRGSDQTARAMLASSDLARLREAIAAGASWRASRDQAGATFTEAAFEAPVSVPRAAIAAGANSFFARWGGAYRRASRELAGLLRDGLPKTAQERLERLDQLSSVLLARKSWSDEADFCARALGDVWRGERTDFQRLLPVAEWCDRLLLSSIKADVGLALGLAADRDGLEALRNELRATEAEARRALEEAVGVLDFDLQTMGASALDDADLAAFGGRMSSMAAATDRYGSWVELEQLRGQLADNGLAELAERIRRRELDAPGASVELRYARAERLWNVAREGDPILQGIGRERRQDIAETFATLERQRLKDNVVSILAQHLAQLPMGALGEMKVIRGEIGKKRGHIALRRLFGRAGNAIQRIKPVLLMSPISVAQFLPPGGVSFDLLVIDEASQVRPEDALGAIARATQIVVVGDKKQLPPSSFFDRVIADEQNDNEGDDEDQGADLLGGAAKLGTMESILTLCEARGLGSRMLNWHYRSRDPSLIAVSNREFYESGLILPPSPLQKDPAYGLCFRRVDGVYDKGGKRDNRKEGEAIVARIAEHARNDPSLSLGVVTFSFAQRNLITELLEAARRTDPVLDGFLREGQSEDLFVKNIENVQGDERDVILVSVGYGPVVPGGRLTSMSFGPVNGEGGERRLNVLFTRARIRCEVFASFDPGDIDPSRSSSEGVRIFKRFLDFAKTGRLEEAASTGLAADSDFEEDVADVIRSFGFLADPQVGSSGFRIDIGVRHPERPGTYLLAVECDGATYHSALWARERDRLRQDVLEHLGWRFHRIWSTDWFYNRRQEIERLRQALDFARKDAEAGARVAGANVARPAAPVEPDDLADFEVPVVVERRMPPYQRATPSVTSAVEPHEVPVATLAGIVSHVVIAEGPIHIEEVARRLASAFGKEKAGSRIISAATSALQYARASNADLRSDGLFWFTRSQEETPPVRDRSAESGATLKAASISLLEIRAALAIARGDNAGGDEAELIRTCARLLGFKRVGGDLHGRISEAL